MSYTCACPRHDFAPSHGGTHDEERHAKSMSRRTPPHLPTPKAIAKPLIANASRGWEEHLWAPLLLAEVANPLARCPVPKDEIAAVRLRSLWTGVSNCRVRRGPREGLLHGDGGLQCAPCPWLSQEVHFVRHAGVLEEPLRRRASLPDRVVMDREPADTFNIW
jgi:hypothetical protein